jgi:hypothetical protein
LHFGEIWQRSTVPLSWSCNTTFEDCGLASQYALKASPSLRFALRTQHENAVKLRMAFALLRYRAAAERSGVSVASLSNEQLLIGLGRLAAEGSLNWHRIDRAASERIGPDWPYLMEGALLSPVTASSSSNARSRLAQRFWVWLSARLQ